MRQHGIPGAIGNSKGSARSRKTEVIYEVYLASFHDSNGDGIGDLRGIIEKLGYIASLGVDALWITPFYPSPEGPEGDGGYAVDDMRSIAPRFGTMRDFETLLEEAHVRNLRVYTDLVLPHTSSSHEWFEKSRKREAGYEDFYVWHPGVDAPPPGCGNGCLVKCDPCVPEEGLRRPPNNWKSVFGGEAWSWDCVRGEYYLHHFLRSQPALNLNRKDVQDAILDVMAFWFEKGVDGMRIDSVPYANCDPQLRNNPWLHGEWDPQRDEWRHQYFQHSMCQEETINLIARMRALAERYLDKTLIGEAIAGRIGGHNPADVAADYVDPIYGLHCCYTTAERGIGQCDAGYLRGMIHHLSETFAPDALLYTVGDHDGYSESPRAFTRVTQRVNQVYKSMAYRQALQLYMTLPGHVSLLMGDELGLPQALIPEDISFDKLKDPIIHTKGLDFCRDGSRTPLPFCSQKKNAGFSTSDDPYLPVPAMHQPLAVDIQERNPDSMLNFTRRLLAWRKAQPALMDGRTQVLNTWGDLVAFLRVNETQTLLCVFNLSEYDIRFTPSDVLDEAALVKTGLVKGETILIPAHGSGFYSAYSMHPVSAIRTQRELFFV